MRRAFPYWATSMVLLALATSCEHLATRDANRPEAGANTPATASKTAVNEADIHKSLTDFAAAMSKNDVVGLDKVWADDFTFVSHDGQIFTKAQLLELLKSGIEKFEYIGFQDVNIRTYGNTAVVTANSTQKATLEGKDHSGTSTVSIVLVKMGDGWRMVLAHLAEPKTS